ncbi:MAG: hypothetical protein ACYC4Q_12620, partial [Victivallaceae bacterium]
LITVIRDNDADIRAVAVSVDHLPLYSVNFNARILSHFLFIGKGGFRHEVRHGFSSHSTVVALLA